MFKEKLQDALGTFGVVLYFIIQLFVCALPFVMIDKSFIITALFFGVEYFFPPSSIVFWIWGLVCAINGPQDVIAIIYYVAFSVIFIPFFISTITSLFKK